MALHVSSADCPTEVSVRTVLWECHSCPAAPGPLTSDAVKGVSCGISKTHLLTYLLNRGPLISCDSHPISLPCSAPLPHSGWDQGHVLPWGLCTGCPFCLARPPAHSSLRPSLQVFAPSLGVSPLAISWASVTLPHPGHAFAHATTINAPCPCVCLSAGGRPILERAALAQCTRNSSPGTVSYRNRLH